MYALFTAIPFAEALGPLLRQAEELQRQGWRVALASAREMAPFVEAEAPTVPFADIGTLGPIADAMRADVEAAAAHPSFTRPTQRIVRMLSSLWPPMFDGLTNLVTADRPDVMVVDFFSSSGLSVAEVHGIPAVINNPDLLACLPATMLPPAAI